MHIVLLEPFYSGSHKAWCDQLQRNSRHQVTILSMEGRYWKWRMHGGAVTLARQFRKQDLQPDLLLASDMLDLSSFLALTRDLTQDVPAILYFHENQMTYPWEQHIVRKNNWRHYGFINFISALSADHIFFNSAYHRKIFLEELPEFLRSYKDYHELEAVEAIKAKSAVLPLGLDLQCFDQYLQTKSQFSEPPLILWNHRWEADKNPEAFAQLLLALHEKNYDFQVALLGETPKHTDQPFEILREKLDSKIIQYGFAESFAEYARLLWQADLMPVTSNQDFFGASVAEAIYCGVYPFLPNRLVYPDYVPNGINEVLYNDYENLQWLMEKALTHILYFRKQNFREWVNQYDWSRMIDRYDEAFEKCLNIPLQ